MKPYPLSRLCISALSQASSPWSPVDLIPYPVFPPPPPPSDQALDLPAPTADATADPYAPGGGLPLYFALARGAEGAPALDMSK